MRQVLAHAFEESYDAQKTKLIETDINNFNKYMNEYLLKQLAYDELAENRLKIEKVEPSFAIVRDFFKGKDYDLRINGGLLYCEPFR